jgi:hypothetical protein
VWGDENPILAKFVNPAHRFKSELQHHSNGHGLAGRASLEKTDHLAVLDLIIAENLSKRSP